MTENQQQQDPDPRRALFAMAALQGLIGRPESAEMLTPSRIDIMTKLSWTIADSMLRTST